MEIFKISRAHIPGGFDFRTVQNDELTARHVNQLGDYSEAVNSPPPGS